MSHLRLSCTYLLSYLLPLSPSSSPTLLVFPALLFSYFVSALPVATRSFSFLLFPSTLSFFSFPFSPISFFCLCFPLVVFYALVISPFFCLFYFLSFMFSPLSFHCFRCCLLHHFISPFLFPLFFRPAFSFPFLFYPFSPRPFFGHFFFFLFYPFSLSICTIRFHTSWCFVQGRAKSTAVPLCPPVYHS